MNTFNVVHFTPTPTYIMHTCEVAIQPTLCNPTSISELV